ncbi:MAG: hydantoinase/oxoprolinase family protein [Anaerolineales bacterium]|nr:hydantoinase/oxoprolinase family protein [Anaerolineales bacterium]
MAEFVLGIDTGGTYTDGVLLNQPTKEVVKTAKTLTTKHDLAAGILKVLDELLPDDPGKVKLVVISTTLATNAIAEKKGRPVSLFLLGYDRELVDQFNLETQFGTSSFHYFQGGHDLYANEQAPLDEKGIIERAQKLENQVDAFAISGYFSPFNASHEERAFQLVTDNTALPVVLGHQLSTRLDSIQRATTATLNASLLSILQAFIQAMRSSLHERAIQAPLMVVRGDGALVSAETARDRPVETVHSGPAASALGGKFLADLDKALVIDMGGTTTDIALIDEGQVRIREEGTTVGKYNTAVRAAHIHSLGLGGDSLIHFDLEDQLLIGPERVQPLSKLAQDHPAVLKDLERLANSQHQPFNPQQIEYWYLQREPTRSVSDPRADHVLEMLRLGPRSLPKILEELDVLHPLQFGGSALLKEEIIGRSSLTPTDLLHITGEFAPWNAEAARLAARLCAGYLHLDLEEFIHQVIQHMVKKIARETISYLTGQTLEPAPFFVEPDDLGLWLFEENYSKDDPYLGSRISLKMPLVGIGAPAEIFLPQVAELLHTEYISPPHFQVANAIGAAAGTGTILQEAWIIPQSRNLRTVGYYVQSGADRKRFRTLQDALEFAEETTRKQALKQAEAVGINNPDIKVQRLPDGAESYRIRARATGSLDPGLES